MPGHDWQGGSIQHKREARSAFRAYEQGISILVKTTEQGLQQNGSNERHIAGKEQDRVRFGGLQRRVNASEWAAAGDQVAPDDPDRQAERPGGGADLT